MNSYKVSWLYCWKLICRLTNIILFKPTKALPRSALTKVSSQPNTATTTRWQSQDSNLKSNPSINLCFFEFKKKNEMCLDMIEKQENNNDRCKWNCTHKSLCHSGGKPQSAKPQSALRDPTLQHSLSNTQTTQLLPTDHSPRLQTRFLPDCTAAAEQHTEFKSTVVSVRHRHQPIRENNMMCLNGTLWKQLKRRNTEDATAHHYPIILRDHLWHAVHVTLFPLVP